MTGAERTDFSTGRGEPDRGRRLEGKVAIVTGGATGIGRSTVERFAREGARVLVNGLPDDPVEEVANAIGDAGIAYAADLTDESNAESCVARAISVFGRVDILINNAGAMPDEGLLEHVGTDCFEQILGANVRTAFLTTRAALRHLRESRGVILFSGSESGVNGKPGHPVYAGTKGWLHAFARSLALAEAAHGVRANCVCPGPVATGLVEEAGGLQRARESARERVPLQRMADPDDIAGLFAYLASDEASYVTGALVLIDGGESIAKGSAEGRTDTRSAGVCRV